VNDQRKEIIIAAFDQFRQYGFKSVTMDDLAKNLGVSKKTLYELFKDKDELVLESVKYMLHDNQDKTEAAFKVSHNAVEQIIKILQLMEGMVRGMNMVCYMEMQKFYPSAYKFLQKHKQDFLYKCVSENLKQGISEGLYREDIDIEIITRFRMESALIVFQNNIFPQDKYDIVKVNTQIFANYMYGIASIKGHKLITKHINEINNK
jgi:AcrR family transcriptional regulator